MKKYFLTPGPSELYFTVEDHIREAMKTQITSFSHRSKEFEEVHAEAVSNLKELFSLPEGYHIYFVNSATECFEHALENLVREKSFHFVNGSFSKRFYDFASLLHKKADVQEVNFGEVNRLDDTIISSDTEMIAVTLNETSSGVMLDVNDIYALREKYPEPLIVMDMVSISPYPKFDFSKVDSAIFSVQKGFGLPSGLGVWIVNERCLEKAKEIEVDNTLMSGTYYQLSKLHKNAMKNQTAITPNVLGIYLLAKVSGDMLAKGLDTIVNETIYKATVLREAVNSHQNLELFVKEQKYRSDSVIVANCIDKDADFFVEGMRKFGFEIGKGYGKYKESQIRIANFPTHSKERIDFFVDCLEKLV